MLIFCTDDNDFSFIVISLDFASSPQKLGDCSVFGETLFLVSETTV